MEKLNTLIKVASSLAEIADSAPRSGTIRGGVIGGGGGALLGLGIGGLTHLLKSDKGLSREEKKERLKTYLKRGTLIGGSAGLAGGAYAGYRTGRRAKEILKTKLRHVNEPENVLQRYDNVVQKKYPMSNEFATKLVRNDVNKSLKQLHIKFIESQTRK